MRHGTGAASDGAESASVGDEVAISGPGRGYEIDTKAAGYLLAGDETALPAISHLFDERGLARSAATVRGYWKQGRSAT